MNMKSLPNTSLTFNLNIFGGPTSGGRNSRTIALIFYYNPILEMATSDLQAQIQENTHLLTFWASFRHQKPFKIEPKVFVPKICNNFTGTNDMAMKLCWLTDMTKMNIYP